MRLCGGLPTAAGEWRDRPGVSVARHGMTPAIADRESTRMSSRIPLPPPLPPKMTPERARHLALTARIAEDQRAAGQRPGQARCGRLLRDGVRRCTLLAAARPCRLRPPPGRRGVAGHRRLATGLLPRRPRLLPEPDGGAAGRPATPGNRTARLPFPALPACCPLPGQDPVDLLVTWHANAAPHAGTAGQVTWWSTTATRPGSCAACCAPSATPPRAPHPRGTRGG